MSNRGEMAGADEGAPRKQANLGYSKNTNDGGTQKKNAKNVCVLVVHYDFKDAPKINNEDPHRKCDADDVENIKRTFGVKRNCNVKDLKSPKKEDLLQLLSSDEILQEIFGLKADEDPAVFILFVLSHGGSWGIIYTDHLKSGDPVPFHSFTTADVFESMRKLKKFSKCLKLVFLGPCRGDLSDVVTYCTKIDPREFDNRGSVSVTSFPKMHNLILFYSTVETTKALRMDTGTWLVKIMCQVLNSMKEDTPLAVFLTKIQLRIHYESRNNKNFDISKPSAGQTPEVKIFTQDEHFTFSALTENLQEPDYIMSCNNDGIGDPSTVKTPKPINEFFCWKSDKKVEIRGRRAIIFGEKGNAQVDRMYNALESNLSFETSVRKLSSENFDSFAEEQVPAFVGGYGCLLTCIFGQIVEDEASKEICVKVSGADKPRAIGGIMHNIIGPKNETWKGKPKLFFVIDQLPDDHENIQGLRASKDERIKATNHSGCLVLILRDNRDVAQYCMCNHDLRQLGVFQRKKATAQSLTQDLSETREDLYLTGLADRLIKIFEGNELKEGKSIQELISRLLITSEGNRNNIMLNTTLQYLLDFPDYSRTIVKPDFRVETRKDQTDRKLNYDSLLQEVQDIKENRIWLLISGAGGGKTTLLKELAHDLRKRMLGVKILQISLPQACSFLADGKNYTKLPPLEDFLAKATGCVTEELRSLLNEGKMIVFFDGFDEIDSCHRNQVIQYADELQRKISIWIGSRPLEKKSIGPLSKKTVEVKILPLDMEQQIELLQKLTGKNEEDCRAIVEEFNDLLQNPLHLILFSQCENVGNLYEIYDEVVRKKVKAGLVDRENNQDNENNIRKPMEKRIHILREFAFRYIVRDQKRSFEIKDEEKEAINSSGIASVVDKHVTFLHQTFAEFLTALKFLKDLEDSGDSAVQLLKDIELKECRKFVESFYSTLKEDEKNEDREKLMKIVKIGGCDLELICSEGLVEIFRMLKHKISFHDHTEDTLYVENGANLIIYALSNEDIALQLLEMGAIKNENELARFLPQILRKATKENSIKFLNRLKEMFPTLPQIIHSQRKEIDAGVEAAWKRHYQVLDFLLTNGVDVNFTSTSFPYNALYAVCWHGNVLYLEELLKHGANITIQSEYGASVIHVAAEWGHLPIIKLLVLGNGSSENGTKTQLVDVNLKDALFGQNALHHASIFGNLEVCRWLVEEAYVDVNVKDEDGKNALHHAAFGGNLEVCRWLVEEAYVDVNEKDKEGKNALHYAAEEGQLEVCRWLVEEAHVDVNVKDEEGKNALHHAAEEGKWEVCRLLVEEAHVDVNVKDEDGKNALHHASIFGNLEVCRWLVEEAHVDVNVKDNIGKNALHHAAFWGQLEVCRWLVEEAHIDDQQTVDSCTTQYTLWMKTRKRVSVFSVSGYRL